MSRQKKITSVVIALIAWTVLGALLGAAGGYVVYVRQPAVFQSEGAIQIAVVSQTAAPRTTEPSMDGSDAESGNGLSNGTDLITSTAVLTKAASQGRLGRLTGIANNKPNEVAEEIRASLQVLPGQPDALGTVFRVRFNGATPSATQKVIQAVLEASVESLSEVDNSANWEEAVQLLTETRQQIEAKLSSLKEQRSKSAPLGRVLVDGEMITVAAQNHRRLRTEFEQLQRLRDVLTQKIRRVQSMLENGAPMDVIMASLDIPIMPVVVKSEPAKESPAAQKNDNDEQKRQLAARIAKEREIQRAMQPLIEERDKLLEKLGRRHPTVMAKQTKIDDLQAKLDQLPPLNLTAVQPTTPTVEPDPQKDEQQEEDATDIGAKVLSSFRSLQAEKRKVDEQYNLVSAQLDEAAIEFGKEEQLALEWSELNEEISAQLQLRDQTIARLGQLSSRPPFPTVRAAILRAPSGGVQVAPELHPLLIRGAQIGLVVGLVLVGLLYLSSLAGSE
ncbi:MAG: hypothetical protein AAGG48_18570 [Planctomycetota bacterium]